MVKDPDWSSATLLERYCTGQADAAETLFSRYADRLILLARSRLSSRLASRTEAEDIALSAWRSFFVAARNGRFALEQPGDLWRLLAGITLHKLHHQVRFHLADRRSVQRTRSISGEENAAEFAMAQPAVEGVTELTDEIDAIQARLDDLERRIFQLKLQGEQLSFIADAIGCSERTVRRTLKRIRGIVAARFEEQTGLKSPHVRKSDGPVIRASKEEAFVRQPILFESALLKHTEFLLERMQGAGCFGKVYRAKRYRDQATVAIKYLRRSYLSEPAIVERFLQEAQTLAELDHPGIVKIQGLGKTAAGCYFLALDWIDGPNLAHVISAGLPSIDRILRWLLALCEALDHTHGRGILHCDLKPNNLLIDTNDTLHVTDFGLARPLLGYPELDGRIEGTPAFMAPEQLSAHWGPIGKATDVYGAGAVLYALLSGRPPRIASDRGELLQRILEPSPVIDARSIRPEIPETLSQICVRCLASEPAARFQSMDELRKALESTGAVAAV
jgi:RNA polymerase sigma factor (sigma-70 family)